MPRPSPSFDEMREKYLKDIVVNKIPDNFNCNTSIELKCKYGHTYKTTITKIKRGSDPTTCPHCVNNKKKLEKGIPLSVVEEYASANGFKVYNPKSYYNKWKDSILLECKKDGHVLEIKSLSYWSRNMKEISCPLCLERDTQSVSDTEFLDNINKLGIQIDEPVVDVTPCFKKTITKKALDKVTKLGWLIETYNGTRHNSTFICPKCGYKKECLVNNLNNCLGCDKIKKKIGVVVKLKEICEENKLLVMSESPYVSVETPIQFKCKQCSTVFENNWAQINGKYYTLHCPKCFKSKKRKAQNSLEEFLTSLGFKVEHENRDLINPYELDLVIHDKKIAFEYCGNVWHCEKYISDKNYHYNKHKMCKQAGYQLITIFEDEWLDINEKCKNRIKSLLGKNENREYARKLKVIEIPKEEGNKFLNENHIQGAVNGSYYIAAVDLNNMIYSLMVFSESTNSKNHDYELVRFCNLGNWSVVGSASKLLCFFKSKIPGKVIGTYSDNRWSTGEFYEKIGFSLNGDIRPRYYYVGEYTKWKRKHRFGFTKSRLKDIFNETEDLTELQISIKNNLYRIWDCGFLRYSMNA